MKKSLFLHIKFRKPVLQVFILTFTSVKQIGIQGTKDEKQQKQLLKEQHPSMGLMFKNQNQPTKTKQQRKKKN